MHTDDAHDRRAHERVRSPELIELDAELIVGPGQTFAAQVLDTSAQGARLAFPETAPPRFYLGTRVELRFRQPGVGKALVAQGQVGNQTHAAGAPVVGVRFVETAEFYRQLTPPLWRQFNRRRRSRMRFRPEPPFVARLTSGERSWRAPVVDLSTIGAGLEVDALDSEDLAGFELLRAAIDLGDSGALALGAVQVHRTPFGHGIRHGLRFDPQHTADFGDAQARLGAFLKRQYLKLRT